MSSTVRLIARQTPARQFVVGVLALALLLTLQIDPAAQQAAATPPSFPKLPLTTGRSFVLPVDFDIVRLAVTNPAIADATVVQPREVLIDGKASGTISLIIWGSGNQRIQYDVVVEQPVSTLEQQLHMLYPGEDVAIGNSDGATILSGKVSSTNVMLRMGEIAAASMPKTQIINLLQVPGGSETQQVMLQVRFAEVNRRALLNAGLSLIASQAQFAARVSTTTGTNPGFDQNGNALTFGDLLNLFIFDRVHGVAGVLTALQQTGAFQSLAEPNLIAYNGQEASFLAGGEIPVPTVSGASGNVTVTYKEFGIRLNFLPTIAGDAIRLKVRPEVSSLDFANGVVLNGFRIPALITRRAETSVELRDGQSFAIAGLLDNVTQNDVDAIPVISKLPIIGPLFKNKAKRQEQTELMVLITPRLVRPLDPDEVPPLPTNSDQFLRAPTDDTQPGNLGRQLEGAGGPVDAPARANPNGVK
jgi:pilus assembly protein CpaC